MKVDSFVLWCRVDVRAGIAEAGVAQFEVARREPQQHIHTEWWICGGKGRDFPRRLVVQPHPWESQPSHEVPLKSVPDTS